MKNKNIISTDNKSLEEAVKSSIRLSFTRSLQVKQFLHSKRLIVERYKKDGSLHKVPYVKYMCAECAELFSADEINVDHIIPVGKWLGLGDVEGEENEVLQYIKRVYCSSSNLQVLCHSCHKQKTVIDSYLMR